MLTVSDITDDLRPITRGRPQLPGGQLPIAGRCSVLPQRARDQLAAVRADHEKGSDRA